MTEDRQQGIYCITNLEKNKRFINSTRNVHTYKTYLLKKLNQNKHKNKRLQNEWNSYQEDTREKIFVFEVLEIVTPPLSAQDRKEYWINYYRSNEVECGYNLEMYKRPWEQERDKWRKNKTWGVDGGVQEFLSSITEELDYSIEFSEDRQKHLDDILNGEREEWLLSYASSPLFCEKQVKNKKDFLTENDISLIGFSYIVDYLTFPKYKNKEEKKQKDAESHPIRKKKSDINMDHRRGNEKLFGHKTEIEAEVSNLELSNPNVKDSENQKIHTVATQHVISESDLKKYPEIKKVHDTIEYLKSVLGQGLGRDNREEKQRELIEKYGDRQVAYMKRMLRDLSTEILIMKEILSGVIRFKRITDGTTVYDYDRDTGYFNESDDYVLISENKIDLSKEKHVLELLNHYSQLRQRFYDNPNSDMWAILFDLDELIEKTDFEEYIKDVLVMKIDGYLASEIIEDIESKHGIELTESRISEIHNKIIPKMIVNTYLQEREDWIYTYKVRGTFKACSKCKEVKLLNEKYFYKEPKGRDGFKNKCKICT